MVINRVINNNVISVLNDVSEQVIMGSGVGFQKKPGDPVDESKIEKIFSLDNKELSDQFQTLLREVPIETMKLVEDIIQFAKTTYSKKLNDIIYVALTDHVNFAIERQLNQQEIKNGMLWEIKKFYKDEFAIGLAAVQMIEDRLNVAMSEDEAGFIAMHIVNAEMNQNLSDVNEITEVIQNILNIVKYHFNIDFDEDSLNYFRFITHLKFFAQRLLSNTYMQDQDDFLYSAIRQKYPHSFECTNKISTFIKKKYDYQLPNEEKLYLTIHIERVVHR
ncbi:BglG family transcription antiterminator LicT [Salinicoccus hispanicus]|uniref:PRD domain-containing protein n=1 Tax=Salinicoccus hispanicus TaxID=157225 RepID=A0A6N8TZN7_9STAP|nr:PRD domain-containing protein [Salinicoccus hispanicus]MXQ51270.1 PRD domain-containing protein [Salinicoccus hispanicus]